MILANFLICHALHLFRKFCLCVMLYNFAYYLIMFLIILSCIYHVSNYLFIVGNYTFNLSIIFLNILVCYYKSLTNINVDNKPV